MMEENELSYEFSFLMSAHTSDDSHSKLLLAGFTLALFKRVIFVA